LGGLPFRKDFRTQKVKVMVMVEMILSMSFLRRRMAMTKKSRKSIRYYYHHVATLLSFLKFILCLSPFQCTLNSLKAFPFECNHFFFHVSSITHQPGPYSIMMGALVFTHDEYTSFY